MDIDRKLLFKDQRFDARVISNFNDSDEDTHRVETLVLNKSLWSVSV